MGRRMDWVPWNLGTTEVPLLVNAGQCVQVPLLNPLTLAVAEVQGVIEVQNRYFIHRIVGQFQIISTNDPVDPVVACVPGLFEVAGADSVTTAFGTSTIGGAVGVQDWTAELANMEFWYWRHYKQVVEVGFNPFEHPWWSSIDIKPKRVMDKQQTPVMAFKCEGTGEVSYQFFLQLRALISPL